MRTTLFTVNRDELKKERDYHLVRFAFPAFQLRRRPESARDSRQTQTSITMVTMCYRKIGATCHEICFLSTHETRLLQFGLNRGSCCEMNLRFDVDNSCHLQLLSLKSLR